MPVEVVAYSRYLALHISFNINFTEFFNEEKITTNNDKALTFFLLKSWSSI